MSDKFCVNCKNYATGDYVSIYCKRLVLDLVTGNYYPHNTDPNYERTGMGGDTCGAVGRYWEVKDGGDKE